MKLIRAAGDQFVFQMGHQEKDLLLEVLQLYPRIPAAYYRLSKASAPDTSSQQLLDEALVEQRTENRKQLQQLLADPARLAPHESHWRLSLSGPEVEWLLQVLNDIRVGSWIALGSPEERIPALNEETVPHIWAMEMAGSFQVFFLKALEKST
ncbi:MAG TPA: hypothetical protein VEC99_15325 [Clostridia bacterium]|nr:hypothetical protein [Clostridia bacterium]